MQEALQRITGAMTDVLRIVASGREGGRDAVPDDVLRRLTGLDGGGEDS
jgi:hypothetical protein